MSGTSIPLRFLPLGGTSVGASCYLYELGGTCLLINCGIQPGLLGAASGSASVKLDVSDPNRLASAAPPKLGPSKNTE